MVDSGVEGPAMEQKKAKKKKKAGKVRYTQAVPRPPCRAVI